MTMQQNRKIDDAIVHAEMDDKAVYPAPLSREPKSKDVQPLIPELSRNGHDETSTGSSQLLFKFTREKKPLPSAARTRWIVASLYLIMTLAGWDTGATAPLLPFLQTYYKISYLVMSIIFIMMFIGGMTSAFLNVYLTDRLGFGIVAPLGTFCFMIGYAISSSGGPYPLFAISFIFNGIGFGFQDAQINALTARLPNPNAKMSLLHSFFGLGGTIAPFISTPFVQHHKNRPYLLYTLCLAVAVVTLAVEIVVFRGRTEEQLTGRGDERAAGDAGMDGPGRAEAAEVSDAARAVPMPLAEMGAAEARVVDGEGGEGIRPKTNTSGAKMRTILTTPAVYVFVLHAFLYVGYETTIGSWAPTYLIEVRGADANAGYVTAGYWGALTVGRIFLIPITAKLGNRWAVLVYTAIAIALQLVTWLVDHYITSAVTIALTGFFLAPIFPAAIVLMTDIFPDELHVGVIGMFGTIGGAGAAATPFILGALADKFGFWVFGPYMTAIMGASIVLWLFVPKRKLRSPRRA